MKRFLGLIILSGFIIMLGAAGGTDYANASFAAIDFLKVVLLEILGMTIVLAGTSALMHYKRYSRRMLIKQKKAKKCAVSRKKVVAAKIRIPEKEFC